MTMPLTVPLQAFAPSVRLAEQAVRALLDEARLSPKPGLVDSRGSGAHTDLDLALMCRSAHALAPAFAAMAEAGREAAAPTLALRERLGSLGREAEAAMLRATGGVNTHRGAIWALGLLVAAAAIEAAVADAAASEDAPAGEAAIDRQSAGAAGVEPTAAGVDSTPTRAAGIAATAGRIARLPDRHAPQRTGHKGETACREFGVAGARGQAQAGFPEVLNSALPELRRSRARGDSETASRLNALLALMSRLDDTCVLSRGGAATLARLQAGAAAVLAAGGVATFAGRGRLRQLDAEALANHASPGGAADLLAATLFLDSMERSDGEA
jgi:triphosphoribosyl-dephospho-CoA synthase